MLVLVLMLVLVQVLVQVLDDVCGGLQHFLLNLVELAAMPIATIIMIKPTITNTTAHFHIFSLCLSPYINASEKKISFPREKCYLHLRHVYQPLADIW
jgi:hypothetical protein